MKGSTLLKVASIVMIIFGAISLFATLFLSVIGAIIGSALDGLDVSLGAFWLTIILSMIASVAEIVAGVVGIVNWNKLDKASLCSTWGIVVIVMCVVANIVSFVLYSDSFKATSLVSGLLFPILYVVGANQNKQMIGTTNNPY